jgi:hypothetical protein
MNTFFQDKVLAPLTVTNQPGHAKSRIFQMKKSNLFRD